MTPEPYLGYFESQMGYEMNMCDALTTHRECISYLPESSSFPVTWDLVRRLTVLVNTDLYFVPGPAAGPA